jgi:signal transduction histidine kinase
VAPVGHILIIDGDPGVRRLIRLAITDRWPSVSAVEASDALELADALGRGIHWSFILWDPSTTPWLELEAGTKGLRERFPRARIWLLESDDPGGRSLAAAVGGADVVLRKDLETLTTLAEALGHGLGAELPTAPDLRPPVATAPPPSSEHQLTVVQTADRRQLIHDLKEPLRTIRLLLERCDRRFRSDLPQEARALIQWAQRTAIQLSEDLDGAAQPEDASEAHTDVNQALQEAMGNLQALIEEDGARITSDPLPTVAVPPSVVRRILENLIGNAIKYRGEGAPEIHVGAQNLRGEGLFSVRDNGQGLPETLRRTVFEPGARGDEGGTGMGLFIVRSLLEQVGGEIWFDTLPGEGTTFFFTLPLAEGASGAESAE